MNATNIQLRAGVALLIVGPQGCGKTRLARKIAQQHGRFAEAPAMALTDKEYLRDALQSKPRTLIVDEIHPRTLGPVKDWIAGLGSISFRTRYGGQASIPTPRLIFTSTRPDPLPGIDPRRVCTVHMAAGGRVVSIEGGA